MWGMCKRIETFATTQHTESVDEPHDRGSKACLIFSHLVVAPSSIFVPEMRGLGLGAEAPMEYGGKDHPGGD